MKKINLKLNFKEIVSRIDNEIKYQELKPAEWAAKVGVTTNIVSNIHGKTGQNPSLEYIIAVSRATGKSIEYYLYGNDLYKNTDDNKKMIHESAGLFTAKEQTSALGQAVDMLATVLGSGDRVFVQALMSNLIAFSEAVNTRKNQDQRIENLEGECQNLRNENKDQRQQINKLETESEEFRKKLAAFEEKYKLLAPQPEIKDSAA
jgi:FtsZ-binding cell division protein ZapB